MQTLDRFSKEIEQTVTGGHQHIEAYLDNKQGFTIYRKAFFSDIG